MNNQKTQTTGGDQPLDSFTGSLTAIIFRLVGLALIDAFALWFVFQLVGDGETLLAATVVLVTVGLNIVFLVDRLYPFRWLAPGLALIVVMVLYPTVITVYYAFTNYATGNLLNETRAIERIEEKPEYRFLTEGEQYYNYTVYGAAENNYDDPLVESNTYLLWLEPQESGDTLIARQETEPESVTAEERGLVGVTLGESEDGVTIVESIEGYSEVEPSALADLDSLSYSYPLETITIGELADGAETENGEGYILDPAQGLLIDFTGRNPTPYELTIFGDNNGNFALYGREIDDDAWLFVQPDAPVLLDGQPQTVGDLRILPRGTSLTIANSLAELVFGDPDSPIQIDLQSANRAGRFQSRYVFEEGIFRDTLTGATYEAIDGTFTLAEPGDPAQAEAADVEILETLTPGYFVTIGFDNFERLLTDERLRGPFLQIFIWTVVHAAISVVITFSLGLALAILLNSEGVPYRKVFRSIILIPYAIPAFISTVMWRGMFDPNLGIINDTLDIFGINGPAWYGQPGPARIAILMIQLWLGFPYMMLICTGALQAIPSDVYEAAEVDGATAWQRFRHMTLPLLLVTVGPLLIASFAFNFNNFTVIELFNDGGPAIPDSSVPAGYTDILITYAYAQAFGGQGGTDYAFASAISIFIFLIVAAVTIVNFRFTKAWEEVSENV